MRALLQRVEWARVLIKQEIWSEIDTGLLALVGVGPTDTEADSQALADKIVHLRVFPDHQDRMNRSLIDVGGSVLLVSQFTLMAQVSKGRRPFYTQAAPPDQAEPLLGSLRQRIEEAGVVTRTGKFGARMEVELRNSGPVTILIDTHRGRVVDCYPDD